ncbi:MAG: hypothetical protein JJU15_06395 [Pararhodobacter sp.]|nr:hypothetical protein [Pararhodobacter sp.]
MVDRSNIYFERRLEKAHLLTFADWKAGKLKSFTAARHSVGLGKPRTRLQEIINAWDKASTQGRDDFLDHLRKQGGHCASATAVVTPPPVTPATDGAKTGGLGYQVVIDGYRTSSAKNRILEIVDRRELRTKQGSIGTGQIRDELQPPFPRLKPALGLALTR